MSVEKLPVDQRRKLHQLVARIDHVDQSWAEQVILFRSAGMGFHRRPEIAGFLAKAYETLQFKANKTAASAHKINAVEVVQAGLFIRANTRKNILWKYTIFRPVFSRAASMGRSAADHWLLRAPLPDRLLGSCSTSAASRSSLPRSQGHHDLDPAVVPKDPEFDCVTCLPNIEASSQIF